MLADIIREHGQELSIGPQTDYHGKLGRYSNFGAALIGLPKVSYGRREMIDVMRAMHNAGFGTEAQQEITVYLLRRAALEAIQDVRARERIWRLLELDDHLLELDDNNMLVERGSSSELVKGFVLEFGKEGLRDYLDAVLSRLIAVFKETEAITAVTGREEDFYASLRRNHNSAASSERTKLELLLRKIDE